MTKAEAGIMRLVGSALRVDPDGNIWRISIKNKPIIPRRAERSFGHGYLGVQYYLDGKPKVVFAHRIVWMFFHGPISDGLQINHKNGIKRQNQPDNLEAITCRENNLHAKRVLHHPSPSGEKHGNAKISDADTAIIRELYSNGEPQRAIAARFGISRSNVSSIVRGRSRKACPGLISGPVLPRSGVKGVYPQVGGKWKAEIYVHHGKGSYGARNVGTYETIEEARMAREAALRDLFPARVEVTGGHEDSRAELVLA